MTIPMRIDLSHERKAIFHIYRAWSLRLHDSKQLGLMMPLCPDRLLLCCYVLGVQQQVKSSFVISFFQRFLFIRIQSLVQFPFLLLIGLTFCSLSQHYVNLCKYYAKSYYTAVCMEFLSIIECNYFKFITCYPGPWHLVQTSRPKQLYIIVYSRPCYLIYH